MRELQPDEYHIKVGNTHRIIHRPTGKTVEKWTEDFERVEFEKLTKGGKTFWNRKSKTT